MSFLSVNTPFSGRYSGEIFNIRTIMDLGGMAILYAHYLQCWQIRVRRELEAVQNVLHNHYQQYQLSQESVDKYLALFAGMETADDAIAYISENWTVCLPMALWRAFMRS